MTKRSTFFYSLIILCISFFPLQVSSSGDVEDLMLTDDKILFYTSESEKYDKKEVISVKNKGLNFYIVANDGKIYSDNLETFINVISVIRERVLTLVESRYGSMVRNILEDEIKSTHKFDGEINFQSLRSISLGYHARQNGRIDFEAMYSWANIKSDNPTPVFDKSVGIFTFLLNFYYNPNFYDIKYAPYISLGIGSTVFSLKKINSSPKNSMLLNFPWFAHQLKLGVNYSIVREVKAFFGYRYFSVPMPVAGNISTRNIEIGLILSF